MAGVKTVQILVEGRPPVTCELSSAAAYCATKSLFVESQTETEWHCRPVSFNSAPAVKPAPKGRTSRISERLFGQDQEG